MCSHPPLSFLSLSLSLSLTHSLTVVAAEVSEILRSAIVMLYADYLSEDGRVSLPSYSITVAVHTLHNLYQIQFTNY